MTVVTLDRLKLKNMKSSVIEARTPRLIRLTPAHHTSSTVHYVLSSVCAVCTPMVVRSLRTASSQWLLHSILVFLYRKTTTHSISQKILKEITIIHYIMIQLVSTIHQFMQTLMQNIAQSGDTSTSRLPTVASFR